MIGIKGPREISMRKDVILKNPEADIDVPACATIPKKHEGTSEQD
jgi:hypothetical protein